MITLNTTLLPRDCHASHDMTRRLISDNQTAENSAVINQGRRQPAGKRRTVRAVAREATLRVRHPKGVGGLELRRPGEDRWVALLPDPSGLPDTFKVQSFDRAGIGPHVGGYASPEAALEAALAAGSTVVATGTFQALIASSEWRARYQFAVTPC